MIGSGKRFTQSGKKRANFCLSQDYTDLDDFPDFVFVQDYTDYTDFPDFVFLRIILIILIFQILFFRILKDFGRHKRKISAYISQNLLKNLTKSKK